MAKQLIQQQPQNHGMVMFSSYVSVFLISALVIAIANVWFPQNVVLGTMSLSRVWAIMLSAAAIALITTFTMPFITQWEIQRNKLATAAEMFSIYLAINFAAVWLITRVAEVFGMGVTSWFVVLVLAIALDLVQGMTMMWLESVKNQNTKK